MARTATAITNTMKTSDKGTQCKTIQFFSFVHRRWLQAVYQLVNFFIIRTTFESAPRELWYTIED